MSVGPLVRQLGAVLADVGSGVTRMLPSRIRAALRERTAFARRMDYARAEIVLGVESMLEHDVRLRSCAKEPGTIRWIEERIVDGDVLFDVGANVGAYTLVAAKARHGKITVYAFEPSFVNYAQLCRNVFLNGCEGCVVPLPVALSNETGLDGFNHSSLVAGAALHALGEARDFQGQSFRALYKQPVLSYRLDDLVAQFGLPVPQHIKIDVDGIEPAVLAGAECTLRDPRLRTLLVELLVGSETERLSVARLEAAGFRRDTVERFPIGADGAGGEAYNSVWVRRGETE